MKKEIFNILFLGAVVLVVGWLYWPQGENANQGKTAKAESFVLALSWQPAFCERKPNKPECRSQRKGRFDTQNFSLHGLWPQPRNNVYCNVAQNIIETDKRGRWNELPKLELSKALREKLSKIMPGYRSNLHLHEWYKHGVCMGGEVSAERYYQVSIAMLEQINNSKLKDLLANNIGREISSSQITRAVEQSFGKGSASRVSVSCNRDGGRTLITELKISAVLEDVADNSWILNAPKIKSGCKRGIVDPVGLQ